MVIKVDEDLPRAVVRLLRESGLEADGVPDEGMIGWPDADLWKAVQAQGRFLVTADKGLADIRTHPPGTHAGVLLVRPDEDGVKPVMDLLEHVLASCELASLVGTVTVATPRGVRIRRLGR